MNTEPSQKQSSLKIDYFLYSCFEFEQTCKAFPGKALGPERWPEAVQLIEGNRETFEDLGTLQEQMEAALRWYSNEFSNLVTDRKIEMENIGPIASACVYFGLDLRLLAGKDSNALEALSSDNNGLWAEIDRIVEALVPNFAHYVGAYLRWVYVKIKEKYWEAGSRPPVGRYTPGARNRRPYGSSPSSGPRRSGLGGKMGGDRDRGTRRDSGDRDHGPRQGSGGSRDGDRNRRPPQCAAGRSSHADQEQAALESVQQALAQLRSDTTVNEVRLDPSNSFFRRLQHKKAVSEGFFSFSTGEGAGRSVVVTREKPAHEDAE